MNTSTNKARPQTRYVRVRICDWEMFFENEKLLSWVLRKCQVSTLLLIQVTHWDTFQATWSRIEWVGAATINMNPPSFNVWMGSTPYSMRWNSFHWLIPNREITVWPLNAKWEKFIHLSTTAYRYISMQDRSNHVGLILASSNYYQ